MNTDAHGRGAEPPASFSEPNLPAPSHAERARTLVAAQRMGSLGSIALEPAGYPYASLITFALDGGLPVFLISRIAEHTRNLSADPRASLLVHESDKADPLANGRVTLVGSVRKLGRDGATSARAAFLAAHPQSAYYADFSDFDFWRLELEAVRYIGGYGRMSWVDAPAFRDAVPDPLAPAAAGILAHMNADHATALVAYARAFTRARDVQSTVMTAIDRYGFEMTVTTASGPGPARVAFESPLSDANAARPALIALLRDAEAKFPPR